MNFQLKKNWRLYLLLNTFTGAWCDNMWASSVPSFRLTNQRVAHALWPDYKICNQFLAWKYRKWWSVSVAGTDCWGSWSRVHRSRNRVKDQWTQSHLGKELCSWLSTLAVFILCCLNCMCPFPIWCLGQDVEFDCIGSWALPFHLLILRFHSVSLKYDYAPEAWPARKWHSVTSHSHVT